jgi:signal transduction histidine kinase
MKNKFPYRIKLLIRIVSLLALGFLLINGVMWIFFRNDVRNIGYYLYYRQPADAVQLIADYVGDPPSKIKSRILTQSFNLTIGYSENNTIRWLVHRRGNRSSTEVMRREMEGMGMHGRGMGEKMHMMNMGQRWDINLSENRVLTIFLPMHLRRRYFYNPFYFFFGVISLIVIFIFLSLKRTLKPIDKIIEASDRIGQGDLTYRVRYERDDDFRKVADAFNTMAARLSSMLSNQRELLHFISHELRTPLARINLALELKDKKQSTETIKNEIAEIDELVEKVSELSRLDSIDGDVDRVRVDLVALLQGLLEKTGDRKVEFKSELEYAWITAHELLIRKAFSNLIDNALKYSDKEKPVGVTLVKDGSDYITTVQNFGPGLSESEMNRIWEPFFRGANAGLKNNEGRGLGLVIVKKAIELSSGEIVVISSPQGPTVFRIKLPAS